MKPQSNTNKAPSPPHQTDKRCYQTRTSWGPSTYPSMGFNSTEEGAERTLYQGRVMPYSMIDGGAPSAQERGMMPIKSKGEYDNRK